jgi:hypothetical protein
VPRCLHKRDWGLLSRAGMLAVLPREPDDDLLDDDEQYYRMLPEGEFLEWDGFTQKQGSRWGLDANRHFPHGYRPEGGQSGAGPHPMFLEVREMGKCHPSPRWAERM